METVESAVSRRYGAVARATEDALCCPVEYDPAVFKSYSRCDAARDK